MTNKNKLVGTLALATLVTTSFAFAQSGSVNVQANVNLDANNMPSPEHRGEGRGEGGFFGKMMRGFQGERKEMREDMKDERDDMREEMRGEMKADMKMMRDKMGSTSTSSMPWKNFHDGKKEMKGDMKAMRDDMRAKMASMTEAQMASVSAKFGITVAQLKARIASDTAMRMKMMASTTASGTMPMKYKGDDKRGSMGGEMNAEVNVNAQGERPKPIEAFRNFFKRIFNF